MFHDIALALAEDAKRRRDRQLAALAIAALARTDAGKEPEDDRCG
jgi:hypothetical protein